MRRALALSALLLGGCGGLAGEMVSKAEYLRRDNDCDACDHDSILSCETQAKKLKEIRSRATECEQLGQKTLYLAIFGDASPAVAGGLAIAAAFVDVTAPPMASNWPRFALASASGVVGIVGALLLAYKDVYDKRSDEACEKAPVDWMDDREKRCAELKRKDEQFVREHAPPTSPAR